jgi:hypothetical protein
MIAKSRKNNFKLGEDRLKSLPISSAQAAFVAFRMVAIRDHNKPDFKSSNFNLGIEKQTFVSTNHDAFNAHPHMLSVDVN